MVKKRASNNVNQAERDENATGQADRPAKNATHLWHSRAPAFEWWEPAPDGFCSSPVGRHRRNPKP